MQSYSDIILAGKYENKNSVLQKEIKYNSGRFSPSLLLAYKITKALKQRKIEDVFKVN